MGTLKTKEQQLKFAQFLIRQKVNFDDKKQDESKFQGLEDLLNVIVECDEKYGKDFAFASLASDNEITVKENLVNLKDPIEELFLRYLTVTFDKDHYVVRFDKESAQKEWPNITQAINDKQAPKAVYTAPINQGVVKKAIRLLANDDNALERHLLTDTDIETALTALGLKGQVIVCPFDPESMDADTLTDRLARQQKETQNSNTHYATHLILQVDGNHWVKVKITVNQSTDPKELIVSYRDSLKWPGSEIEPKTQPKLLEIISKLYPDFKIIRDFRGAEIRQPGGWECGYLSLRSTACEFQDESKEFKYSSLTTESKPSQNFSQDRVTLCQWEEADSFTQLRNIVYRLILKAADIEPLDYLLFNKGPEEKEDRQAQYFQVNNGTQIKLKEEAIDIVLNKLTYRSYAQQPKPDLPIDTKEEDKAREEVEALINNHVFWSSKVHYSWRYCPDGITKMQFTFFRTPHDTAATVFEKYKEIARQKSVGLGFFALLLSCFLRYPGGRDPITDHFYLAFTRANSFSELVKSGRVSSIKEKAEITKPVPESGQKAGL